MTADVVDLTVYRRRREKRDRYDQLSAQLRAGVIMIPPSSLTSAIEWDEPRSADAIAEDLRGVAEDLRGDLVVGVARFIIDDPHDPTPPIVDVRMLRLLVSRSYPRMTQRRRVKRAAARRRRSLRGW